MNRVVRRLVSRVVEQFAGTGVSIDESGCLTLPDGLDAGRAHRFVELCLDRRFDHPKAALGELFVRIGVAPQALAALDQVVGPDGELDLSAVARNPVKLGFAVSSLLEIPVHVERFLVEGLGLAEGDSGSLEEAVVSTRERAAERLGCPPTWEAILGRPDEVRELARGWRERAGGGQARSA
jgi:hypothetical protein